MRDLDRSEKTLRNSVAANVPFIDGARPASQQAVSVIMLTPVLLLVLLLVFSAVGSALAGG
ncbi:MAG TPA: hypothetical protein VGF58_23695 [Burkholderiales bacterium]|jgi:hypothetical protein